jgi:hypothetical protein
MARIVTPSSIRRRTGLDGWLEGKICAEAPKDPSSTERTRENKDLKQAAQGKHKAR